MLAQSNPQLLQHKHHAFYSVNHTGLCFKGLDFTATEQKNVGVQSPFDSSRTYGGNCTQTGTCGLRHLTDAALALHISILLTMVGAYVILSKYMWIQYLNKFSISYILNRHRLDNHTHNNIHKQVQNGNKKIANLYRLMEGYCVQINTIKQKPHNVFSHRQECLGVA